MEHRLTRVSSDSGVGAGYRYDRNGRQTQVLYANGMKTSYHYDSRSRLTGMETIVQENGTEGKNSIGMPFPEVSIRQ